MDEIKGYTVGRTQFSYDNPNFRMPRPKRQEWGMVWRLTGFFAGFVVTLHLLHAFC